MKIFILLISFILFACNNNKAEIEIKQVQSSEIELLLRDKLIKSQNFALNKLELKNLNDLKSKTLRIWRFPGGGACFEELYELNIDKKELKIYLYLIANEEQIQPEDSATLEYHKVLESKELTKKLLKFLNKIHY